MPKSPEEHKSGEGEDNKIEKIAEEPKPEQNFGDQKKESEEELFEQREKIGKENIVAEEERKKEEEATKEKLESLREEILELAKEDKKEAESDIYKALRIPQRFSTEAVHISAQEKQLISEISADGERRLDDNYERGFGVSPTSVSTENFYGQQWTRDFAHAASNYFAYRNPEALKDSLNTIFKHQRSDGMLPLRVEQKSYLLLKIVPLIGRPLAGPLFNLIEKKIRGRDERPVYQGQDFSNAEDTVPTTIIAVGEYFINRKEGEEFVRGHLDQIEKAVDFFKKKTDPSDRLVVIKEKEKNPDWADSLKRGGKLGGLNVWWARSLRLMEFMMNRLGEKEKAKSYREEFIKVKKSILEKLYNKEEGYFRTAEGEDRVDTPASVFGALYLLNPQEAAKLEETLEKRVGHKSGLKNFDPPYPKNQIFLVNRIFHPGYHNEYVWPWVTLQNIQVKVKIALQHPEEAVRNKFKKEAVADFIDMADLFKNAGGAYEIFEPDTRKPATSSRWYKPPKNLMGNMAAFQGVYMQLKELGWLEEVK